MSFSGNCEELSDEIQPVYARAGCQSLMLRRVDATRRERRHGSSSKRLGKSGSDRCLSDWWQRRVRLRTSGSFAFAGTAASPALTFETGGGRLTQVGQSDGRRRNHAPLHPYNQAYASHRDDGSRARRCRSDWKRSDATSSPCANEKLLEGQEMFG